MSWLDRFRKKHDDPNRFDHELLERLDALAFANAKVRSGELEAERINLCPNVNAEGVIEADRPAVSFRLEPNRRERDTWSFVALIDDPTGHLRFLLDLEVPKVELDARAMDPQHMPGLQLTLRRHPEYEHGELARSHCALHWRAEIDASFLEERSTGPIQSGTVVMGSRLTRTPVAYAAPGSGSWVLLKCSEPGPFFVAFDAHSGEAEMFPRRYDADSYLFAMELLRVVA